MQASSPTNEPGDEPEIDEDPADEEAAEESPDE